MRRVYLVNVTDMRLVLFAGRLTLEPQGTEGSVHPMDARSAEHADVQALKARKQLRIMTQEQYIVFLQKKGKGTAATAAVPVAVPPSAPVPVAVVAPPAPEEPVLAPEEPSDLMSTEEFGRLSKAEQLEAMTALGIELTEDNSRTKALAEATYAAWHAANS